MRKSREGIGRLGAVLFLCLALNISAVPVFAEPRSGAVKAESKASGSDSGAVKTESKASGSDSGAVKTESKASGTDSGTEKTESASSGEEAPDIPLTDHTQAEAVE